MTLWQLINHNIMCFLWSIASACGIGIFIIGGAIMVCVFGFFFIACFAEKKSRTWHNLWRVPLLLSMMVVSFYMVFGTITACNYLGDRDVNVIKWEQFSNWYKTNKPPVTVTVTNTLPEALQ